MQGLYSNAATTPPGELSYIDNRFRFFLMWCLPFQHIIKSPWLQPSLVCHFQKKKQNPTVVVFLVATAELPVRRGDGVRAEQLRHSAGEGTPRAGVEAAGGAEEPLWEGEEEVHRGSDKTRGRGDARASCQWVRSDVWNKKQRPTQLTLAVACFCRGRPSRRTGPCGSKTSFWTWLRLRTYRNPRCQSLKVPSWSVSLYGTLSYSIALLHAGHVIKPRWAPARQLTLAGHVDQAHISGFFRPLPLAAAKRAVGKAGGVQEKSHTAKIQICSCNKVDSVVLTEFRNVTFVTLFLFSAAETNATTKPAPKNVLECTSESRRPSAECASLTASSTAAARWTPCLIPAHR